MPSVRFSSFWTNFSLLIVLSVLCSFSVVEKASAVDFEEYPAAKNLVSELSTDSGLDSVWVEAIVRDAVYTESIIEAITRPAEKFPWHRYRKIFITDSNAKLGVKFWNTHENTLKRAEEEFGVDSAIMVAIIGVETRFGRITGRHRVIDSLVTLVLGYPRRKDFFQKELAEFIRLADEENLNVFDVRGSYAGAMGIPQFISSSYRNYAVDFNGNQQRDLLTETADAIGSIGNYLSRHGWSAGGPIFTSLTLKDANKVELVPTKGLKSDRTFGEIADQVKLLDQQLTIEPEQDIGVVKLETAADQFEYRVAFPNFYVITTYNRSNLYAMAVTELANLISAKRSKN